MTDDSQDQYDDLDRYAWLQDEVDFHELDQAIALGKLLHEKLRPRPASVIDFGCSSGIYLVPWICRKITDVLGVDGAHGVGKWIPGRFEVVDFRKPWTPPKMFDLGLCIETGEHIRKEFHPVLVETISKGAYVVFWSAAPPGQGGEGHVGEMPKQYWIDLFAAFGYHIHPLNDEIVSIIQKQPESEHCGWLRTNSVVFQK
jgi:hypothetical protein